MGNRVTNRNEWLFGALPPCTVTKDDLYRLNMVQMLQKTVRMFEWRNLPGTIPAKDLETLIQVQGYAVIGKDQTGALYAFRGGLGGEPNPYYLPTKAVVANPALRWNKTYTINEDCTIILNDNYYQGVMPLFNKYASLMTEAELTLRQALLNHRVPAAIQADNDKAAKSAEQLFDKVLRGDQYGVIASNEFLEGCKAIPFNDGQTNSITQAIEAIQYIKGSWLQEIGVNAPFNMKREALNAAETTLNEDSLVPYIDTMLKCRQEACERMNEMFGLGVSVDFAGVWKENALERSLTLEQMEEGDENDIGAGEGTGEETGGSPDGD